MDSYNNEIRETISIFVIRVIKLENGLTALLISDPRYIETNIIDDVSPLPAIPLSRLRDVMDVSSEDEDEGIHEMDEDQTAPGSQYESGDDSSGLEDADSRTLNRKDNRPKETLVGCKMWLIFNFHQDLK